MRFRGSRDAFSRPSGRPEPQKIALFSTKPAFAQLPVRFRCVIGATWKHGAVARPLGRAYPVAQTPSLTVGLLPRRPVAPLPALLSARAALAAWGVGFCVVYCGRALHPTT